MLLVFCFLIAPAVAASLFATTLRGRLALGWLVGVGVSAVGLLFSYDRPSGPTIPCAFAAFLSVAATVRAVMRSSRPGRAVALVGAALAAALGLGVGVDRLLLPEREDDHDDHPHDEVAATAPASSGGWTDDPEARARAAARLDDVPALMSLLEDKASGVREAAVEALGRLGAKEAVPALEKAMTLPSDSDWTPLALATALADLGAPSGRTALERLAREGEGRKVRERASTRLAQIPAAE